MLINASRSRDILECIASLSSDEVATPPAVANQVLDLLPAEVWSNKDLRWLDPACKTGVFLREAARRLMEGLKDSIPDETERRKHIFTNMLHGYALTELTAQMSRRSLYYNKDASSKKLSVVPFKSEEGNIQFSGQDHPYNTNGKCNICGAGKEVFGAPGNRERHAYDFIHSEEGDMKFDVVVGNPPYQIESGGYGAQATPIYNLFVQQAMRLRPRYLAMIIPSRWFSGGIGLESFRLQMLQSTSFRRMVDYPNASDLFPGVEVKGGVCYFLWDADYEGPCQVTTFRNGVAGPTAMRLLGQFSDVFVRFNEALSILEKVDTPNGLLSESVSPINPFGIPTNFSDTRETPANGFIGLYTSDGLRFTKLENVKSNHELIIKYKVLISKAYGAGDDYPHQIIGKPIIAEPNTACTMTYIVAGSFNTLSEAESFSSYLQTKFVRFLVALRKPTQDVSRKSFGFVPVRAWNEKFSDEQLFKKYSLNSDEIAFVNSLIREMVMSHVKN